MGLKWILCYICLIWILSVSCISFAYNPFLFFTDKKTSEIAAKLTSSCDPSVCHSADIVQLITYGSSFQYYQILHILNEKGPLCLQFTLEALKNDLNKYNGVPNSCEDLVAEEKRSCQDLQTEYAVVNDRVLSLVNLMVSQESGLIMPFTQQLLENKAPSLYINTGLLNFLQRLEDERSCDEYKIGEEREFIITPFQSNIIPYTYYRIRRESEKHYKAFLVLEFSPHSSYTGIFVPEDHDHYIEKVKSCMSQVNSKMQGPNGEMLEIVIEDARQVDACRTKLPIQVGFFNRLASVKYYHENMSCASTTHETMHALGLWDEYYWPGSECRMVQENSMLSEHHIRWKNVFDNKLYDSLLDPSYFQSILYGNCSLRNDVKLYRRCSRLSYQTLNNTCLDERAYCDRQNVLGRDKIAEQQRISDEIQTLQAKLNAININTDELTHRPDFSRSDPEYLQRESIRSKLLYRQREIQKRIPYLQKRLDFVLAWPDP